MVDNDSLLDLLQELRRCHEFRNVGIDDDEDGLVCDKALRFTGIDDEAFDFAALFDGFCILRQVSLSLERTICVSMCEERARWVTPTADPSASKSS